MMVPSSFFRNQAPGSRFQVPGPRPRRFAWNMKHGTWNFSFRDTEYDGIHNKTGKVNRCQEFQEIGGQISGIGSLEIGDWRKSNFQSLISMPQHFKRSRLEAEVVDREGVKGFEQPQR